MKTLLRSCFIVGGKDKADLFFQNFLALQQSGLGFEVDIDLIIWTTLAEFATTFNHVPELKTLRTNFDHLGEQETLDRLDMLENIPALSRGDFLKRLDIKAEERRQRLVADLLTQAGRILQRGEKIEDKLVRGPVSALHHVIAGSHDILAPTTASRLSGEVWGDGEDFWREYNRIKMDPTAGLGQYCGIEQIDVSLSGARARELWIHAAWTGGLKSTFALNWAYIQSIYYKFSSAYFSLEMPYDQCRRKLFALHSISEKFNEVRLALGLQKDPHVSVGLPYKAIRDGKLDLWHPRAEEYLHDHVIPDLDNGQATGEYGRIHIEVQNPDNPDFTSADLRSKAEVLYSGDPFGTIFVDHVGLMTSRNKYNSTTESLNEVLRDLKSLARGFNRGQGIAVVALMQISRKGFAAAQESKRKTGLAQFNLTHLSYSNEAERSGDRITTTWKDDELADQNRILFQCLKARDDEPFKIFYARIEWPCMRMFTTHDKPMSREERENLGKAVDADQEDLDELLE